jgi:hypothetical protein
MAHFAKIENNIVTQVVVVADEHEAAGQAFLNSIGLDGTWVQTSYNGNIRKNFAGIGYSYNQDLDAFIHPQPYPSWVLDEETCQWEAPTPRPADGGPYAWNEDSISWVEYEGVE